MPTTAAKKISKTPAAQPMTRTADMARRNAAVVEAGETADGTVVELFRQGVRSGDEDMHHAAVRTSRNTPASRAWLYRVAAAASETWLMGAPLYVDGHEGTLYIETDTLGETKAAMACLSAAMRAAGVK